MEPGWTSYPNRLLYATYDVTDLLAAGGNALSAAVGDGWYRGHLTWHRNRDVYGNTCALLAQLEVTLADGTTVTVATDDQWRGGHGGLLAADLYDGCERDLRREPHGWQSPGFDDREWEHAVTLPLPAGLVQRAHRPYGSSGSSGPNDGHCPTARPLSTRARTSPAGSDSGPTDGREAR
ncbi:alpha-L-rhamnosidase N-terminal domain-containing protein [Streptomyces sp. NPDC051001]|uniref:alpha-L-rhamnosidase N-terminal domain-containing protein n=1 Tax=Streptomyces sp. NPDC051001 TaxID=3155795 RepID=UPI00341B8AB8